MLSQLWKKGSCLAGLILLVSTSLWASGSHDMKKVEKKVTDITESVKGSQKLCPVKGKAIDDDDYVDFQGQRVYFCCQGCEKKFKADPEAYFAKMKERGEVAESNQTVCPVSGDALKNHNVFVELAGRKIYFCCKDCIEDFNKDPAKVLKALDNTAIKNHAVNEENE